MDNQPNKVIDATYVIVKFDWLFMIPHLELFNRYPPKDLLELALMIPETHQDIRPEIMLDAIKEDWPDSNLMDDLIAVNSILHKYNLSMKRVYLLFGNYIFKEWIDNETMCLVKSDLGMN